jgi:DNA-binding NarL/FixJ family response regulator
MLGNPLRVVVVNDYEVIVRGVTAMLQPFADRVRVVGQEVETTPDRPANVALYDTFGSSQDDLADRCRQMREEGLVDHVVLYTWNPGRPIASGAPVPIDGVISKREAASQVVDDLERIVAGAKVGVETMSPVELTVREHEILGLMAVGRTNREIARTLFVSEETVKTYAKRLFKKLGVRNRVEAAARAATLGFAG